MVIRKTIKKISKNKERTVLHTSASFYVVLWKLGGKKLIEENFINIYKEFGISDEAVRLVEDSEREAKEIFEKLNKISEFNQAKVLMAMQKNRLSDIHFNWNTGYGYNDAGREITEKIYSDIFKTEDAIVRPLIVNGTHALTLCLSGILRPGDKILAVSGRPYDTLENVIGINGPNGSSLMEIGVLYDEVDLNEDGSFNEDKILASITDNTKMVYIQRSSGYSWRKAITISDIEYIIKRIKNLYPETVIMVDNCYGEFLDYKEPTEVGADIMAGSLIKNPGGGLALSGGYVVGRRDLIELVSYKMTSPGIGKECGLMFGQTRNILQGLFLAPTVSISALKNAILCAKVFEKLAYEVCPKPQDYRSDIIQAIKLGSAEKIIDFCKGVQSASPVDSFVTPLPWDMPGYTSEVIMAAGAFVQGSSIELSADAPIKEPYIVYFQGGLTHEHGKIGILKGLSNIMK